MEKTRWLMPKYYKDFKCKCEKCRQTCCHGWQIPLTKDEYFKLMSMDCNEEIRHRLDVSFVEPEYIDNNRYRVISFNYLGDCPLYKDGLCEIHKNFGENHLPSICRLYPRSLKQINNVNIACLSSSCERVIEMLIDEDAYEMIEDTLEAEPTLKYTINSKVDEELKHFTELLKDRETTLEYSIRQICLEVNKEAFIKDYNVDINPLTIGLKLLTKLARQGKLLEIANEIINRYSDNYYQYEIDKEEFEKLYPKWMNYFENILNNSLLFENFPFVDNRFDKTYSYKGLCASYGLLRLICIGYCTNHKTKEDLVDAISSLFHLIDHTAFYYNVNALIDNAAIMLKL